MDYATVKLVHQSAVVLSGTGFAVRAWAAMRGLRWVRGRAAKTVPHVVDTVLLASALTLLWMLRLNPAGQPWLLAKMAGLLLYIALGVVSLRPRFAMPLRAGAAAGALLVLGWIASVAFFKNPLGFFALLV